MLSATEIEGEGGADICELQGSKEWWSRKSHQTGTDEALNDVDKSEEDVGIQDAVKSKREREKCPEEEDGTE